MKTKTMEFAYPEDMEFFDNLLGGCGGVNLNTDLFDLRNPANKRREFNKIRKKVFAELVKRYGSNCELICHPGCTGVAIEVDHLIPLASNVLNKELRGIKGKNGKKTPAQSFGSNAMKNLVLACSRCNAFKKHRMPSERQILDILKFRDQSGKKH